MTDQAAQQPGREFALSRIYTKDISFETPNSPTVFSEEWKPSYNMNITSEVNPLPNDHFEVIINVTVTCKVEEKTAFLVEVKQAGIFRVSGFPKEEMGPMLGAYCPNLLFPYAREVVSDLVAKGSFPQLLLTPVNFDAIYARHLQQQKEQAEAAGEGGSGTH
jgi:preprotein translocase subunit SecB